MFMDYCKGINLLAYLQGNKRIPEPIVKIIIKKLLNVLIYL